MSWTICPMMKEKPLKWAQRGVVMDVSFRLDIEPPTATAQEKQVRLVCGHPQFYEKKPAKEAKKLITDALMFHKPEKPLEGALLLTVKWLFPKRKADRFDGERFKTTKPDTDNLQ